MKPSLLKVLVLGLALGTAPALAAVPDGLITAKAKMALWTSEVRSTGVRVDTTDGVVTLSGKVPSAEKKNLAEQKVRGLDGVRSVNNLLQVVPAAEERRVEASDKELLKKAKRALRNDRSLDDSRLTARSVDQGVVLLEGEASDADDQLHAVALLDRIPGVRGVNSQVSGPDGVALRERGSFSAEPTRKRVSDTRITGAVKLKLLTTAHIPSTEISVDTTDGVVTLFGMVPTDEVKHAAGIEAARVSGVKKVENQLQVVSTPQKETAQARDEDLDRDLKLAFKGRPEFKDVNTAVRNGVVQLSGQVSSAWEELAAVRVARGVKGVRGVTNLIKVEGSERRPEGRPGT